MIWLDFDYDTRFRRMYRKYMEACRKKKAKKQEKIEIKLSFKST